MKRFAEGGCKFDYPSIHSSLLRLEMLLLHGSRHFDPRSGVKVFVTDMVQGARRVALETGPILSNLSIWTEGDL